MPFSVKLALRHANCFNPRLGWEFVNFIFIAKVLHEAQLRENMYKYIVVNKHFFTKKTCLFDLRVRNPCTRSEVRPVLGFSQIDVSNVWENDESCPLNVNVHCWRY